jgi:exosome complex RNA-binding protein Csl4
MDEPSPPPARVTSGEVYVCDRCGEPLEERQCQIVCRNCGMVRDCSDP